MTTQIHTAHRPDGLFLHTAVVPNGIDLSPHREPYQNLMTRLKRSFDRHEFGVRWSLDSWSRELVVSSEQDIGKSIERLVNNWLRINWI